MTREPLLPPHGCRQRKSFPITQLVDDLADRFADRCVEIRSRPRDPLAQAARRGAQSLVEGSEISATSQNGDQKN